MAPRAVVGRLVGMEGFGGHIYHIWLPEEDRVVRVRDVRFHEFTSDFSDPPIAIQGDVSFPIEEQAPDISGTVLAYPDPAGASSATADPP